MFILYDVNIAFTQCSLKRLVQKNINFINPPFLKTYRSEARNDVVNLHINVRTAKEIELFLKYDVGKKILWWFSYAIAKSEDNIKSIESDGLVTARTGKVPRTNNQFHTLYADLNYLPNQKWHYSISGQCKCQRILKVESLCHNDNLFIVNSTLLTSET